MKRLATALLAAAALSACGTTVPVSQQASVGDGLSSTGGIAPGGQGGATTGQGSTGATSGGSAGGPTAGTARPSSAATAPSSRGHQAPGGTGSVRAAVKGGGPVRVGLLYLDGVDSFANALGISGLSTGDTVAQAKAIVAHLNSTGGFGGRTIELRYGRIAASDASNEQAFATVCAQLTEDDKVSYVVSYLNLNALKVSCYAKHGVPVLDDQSALPDSSAARFPKAFLAPGELLPGRMAGELVEALWRTGWLTSKSVVGSFVYDTPEGVELETRYLSPALARHGLAIKVNARVSNGAGAANQNNTALKMRSSGVDRVIPIGASPLFLMNAAESQGYRPQYAMTSTFGPGALIESTAPRNQLTGSRGIGWSKHSDIGAGSKPGPVSPNETLCLKIMKDAGQQGTGAVPTFQTSLCNVLMLLKAATDRYGRLPDLLPLLRQQRMSFPPADAFAIRLDPSRTDGATAYRDLAFDDACGCYQYVSGNRPTTR